MGGALASATARRTREPPAAARFDSLPPAAAHFESMTHATHSLHPARAHAHVHVNACLSRSADVAKLRQACLALEERNAAGMEEARLARLAEQKAKEHKEAMDKVRAPADQFHCVPERAWGVRRAHAHGRCRTHGQCSLPQWLSRPLHAAGCGWVGLGALGVQLAGLERAASDLKKWCADKESGFRASISSGELDRGLDIDILTAKIAELKAFRNLEKPPVRPSRQLSRDPCAHCSMPLTRSLVRSVLAARGRQGATCGRARRTRVEAARAAGKRHDARGCARLHPSEDGRGVARGCGGEVERYGGGRARV